MENARSTSQNPERIPTEGCIMPARTMAAQWRIIQSAWDTQRQAATGKKVIRATYIYGGTVLVKLEDDDSILRAPENTPFWVVGAENPQTESKEVDPRAVDPAEADWPALYWNPVVEFETQYGLVQYRHERETSEGVTLWEYCYPHRYGHWEKSVSFRIRRSFDLGKRPYYAPPGDMDAAIYPEDRRDEYFDREPAGNHCRAIVPVSPTTTLLDIVRIPPQSQKSHSKWYSEMRTLATRMNSGEHLVVMMSDPVIELPAPAKPLNLDLEAALAGISQVIATIQAAKPEASLPVGMPKLSEAAIAELLRFNETGSKQPQDKQAGQELETKGLARATFRGENVTIYKLTTLGRNLRTHFAKHRAALKAQTPAANAFDKWDFVLWQKAPKLWYVLQIMQVVNGRYTASHSNRPQLESPKASELFTPEEAATRGCPEHLIKECKRQMNRAALKTPLGKVGA